MRVDMSTLNVQNFSYYALKPRAPSLNMQDQRIAILATALLALTFGLGHLVCAIIYAVHKKAFEASLLIPTSFRELANSIGIHDTERYSPIIIRSKEEGEEGYSYSENEQDIRQFERDALRIPDPLFRSGALLAADVGRGLNSIRKGLSDMGFFLSKKDF
jgi:hypothetical protein